MADLTHSQSYTQLMEAIAAVRENRDAHRAGFTEQLGALRAAVEGLITSASGTLEKQEEDGEKLLVVLQEFLGEVREADGKDQAEALAQLQAQLDAEAKAKNEQAEALAVVQAQLDAETKAKNESAEALAQLQAQVDAEATAKNEGDQALAQLQARLEAEAAAKEEATTRCETLEAELESVRTAAAESGSAQAALEARIGELEGAVSEKASASEGLAQDLEAARTRIATLEEEAGALGAAGASLEKLQGEYATLEAAKGAAEEAAASAQSRLEETQAKATALEAELDEVRQALAKAKADPVDRQEAVRMKATLQDEQDKVRQLEERLKDEMARGTKAALATQLAEAVSEAEETREHLRLMRQELERLRRERDGSVDVPTQLERIKEVWRKQEHGTKLVVGEILRRAGICTAEQIEEALNLQRETPSKHIGTILIEHRYASEEAVSQARACQCEVEFISFTEDTVDAEAAALLSKRLAQQHTCIPISATEEQVIVAIANPMDLVAIEDIERSVNRRVEIVVGTPSTIHQAIEKYYWEPE